MGSKPIDFDHKPFKVTDRTVIRI